MFHLLFFFYLNIDLINEMSMQTSILQVQRESVNQS